MTICTSCIYNDTDCPSDENDVEYGKSNDVLKCRVYKTNKLKEAKALSIEMWTYLAAHPECRSKEETPFWHLLKDLKHNCPLCSVVDCPQCPIYTRGCTLYRQWLEGSVYAAAEILGRIEAWRV